MASSADYALHHLVISFLLSPEGADRLSELADTDLEGAGLVRQLTRLRQQYPPEFAAALVDQSQLRTRARAKFERAYRMLFTSEALEQASAEVVARHRAQRFAGCDLVLDLGCGIGGDSLALAAVAPTLGLERDDLRLRMAAVNTVAYGVGDAFHPFCADVLKPPLAVDRTRPYIWADPARRHEGRRLRSLQRVVPPLPDLLRTYSAALGGGIKLSPAVDYIELASILGDLSHEMEIISVGDETREAVLWFGALRTAERRATLLPGGHTLVGAPARGVVPITPLGRYLYEPDGAVIRAHLVENLAQSMGATKPDEQIAYLTSDAYIETPFARAYVVDAVLPYSVKAINRWLTRVAVTELVIKKRGLDVDPERFRGQLRYRADAGEGEAGVVVLVLTRLQDRARAIICRRARPSDAA